MGRKKKLPLLTDVKIEEIAAEGKGLAKINDIVIFVPQAIPGDVMDVQITRKRSYFMEGKCIELKNPSTLRIKPVCEHFGICGGCKWLHLPYNEQLKWKQKQVIDALERIGRVKIEKIHPIIPSDNVLLYRNKLEYTFSDNRWLPHEVIKGATYVKEPGAGFHIQGMFDKVLDIQQCYLQPEPSNHIRLSLKNFLIEKKIPFYNLKEKKGLVRNIIIRNNSMGHFMAVIVFGENNMPMIAEIMEYISRQFQNLHSLMYGINTKLNDSLHDIEFYLWRGEPFITEVMENLQFRIGPKSFFQTNTLQAYRLYEKIRSMSGVTNLSIVYDLYTGTGTIALFVGKIAKKVIGIEYIQDAINDARINATVNNMNHLYFYSGDVKDILTTSFIKEHGKPDVVITDPPRAGMHENVVKTILNMNPERIVYVSCNPATQARDLKILNEKYVVQEIQPIDMFPHTHHVENIALLVRK